MAISWLGTTYWWRNQFIIRCASLKEPITHYFQLDLFTIRPNSWVTWWGLRTSTVLLLYPNTQLHDEENGLWAIESHYESSCQKERMSTTVAEPKERIGMYHAQFLYRVTAEHPVLLFWVVWLDSDISVSDVFRTLPAKSIGSITWCPMGCAL